MSRDVVHLAREATQRWSKLAKKADEAECPHDLSTNTSFLTV